ncbi:MAG: ATP-dependent DNA helicase RecG [Myxococcota bacterium]|nr:ATP-dependent DNA helicase RecG [Myxococcota bacterium]
MAARQADDAAGPIEDVVQASAVFEGIAIPPDSKKAAGDVAARLAKASGKQRPRVVRELGVGVSGWLQDDFAAELLRRPLSALSGVGDKRAQTFAERGLRCIEDLLFHLPSGYDDRRALSRVGDLEVGRRATFIGTIRSVDRRTLRVKGRSRRILEAVVGDDTGSVNLKWFRALSSLDNGLERGGTYLVTGDVKRYRFSLEIVHPELTRLHGEEESAEGVDAAAASEADVLRSVEPVYPTLEGVPPRTLRKLIRSALLDYSDLVQGHLPREVVVGRGLPEVGPALRLVHAPDLHAELADYEAFRSPAHARLVLEELYLLQLGLVLRRAARGRTRGVAIDVAGERVRAAPESLPFRLTEAQLRVWREISRDLSRRHPMNRLLQGDVGSGKTAIALLAAVAVAASGRQAALMAPTELLAEQHARSLERLIAEAPRVLGLRIGLLTSSLPRKVADERLATLAAGGLDLVVGTHALIQERVVFRDLALAIVDEQHRFGVLQRAALSAGRSDGAAPHVLVMTATPIPRTLALTGYGDLDLSVIDELPPGRTPTRTQLMQQGDGARIMDAIRETTGRGEQVYVVYPLVEESEKLDLRSAMDSAERIARAFPELRVELVHGRLDAETRGRIMDRFGRGDIDILVATTVIEVGVDVANASLMIVEHAERFGLAQLHQLRGRVGRGSAAGTCLLVSRGGGGDARARLAAMLRTNDGFEIADADLAIRGPGEFLGTRQSGELADLRLADLVRDAALLEVARETAIATLDSDLGLQKHPSLLRAVEGRWGERLKLIEVG